MEYNYLTINILTTTNTAFFVTLYQQKSKQLFLIKGYFKMENDFIYPRVFVSTYLKYSENSLEGKWFDLADYQNKTAFIEIII